MSFTIGSKVDLTDWQLKIPRGNPAEPPTDGIKASTETRPRNGLHDIAAADARRAYAWHQRDRLTTEQWRAIYRPCGLVIKETPVCYHGGHCVNGQYCGAAIMARLGVRDDG